MKSLLFVIMAGLGALFMSQSFSSSNQASRSNKLPKDEVVKVATGDAAMTAARKRAQETIGLYWKAQVNPQKNQGRFSIKVRVADKFGVEHFWVSYVARNENGYIGVIANKPVLVKKVKEGQSYKFTDKEISDWMYMRDGKIYGGYSIRVLVDKMPKKQADKMRALLAYKPS